MMATFLTPNQHPYAVKFSPHEPNRVAVAASDHYGFAGGGSLFILELWNDYKGLVEQSFSVWRDGLFDVDWSPKHPSVITASGDGSVQCWNVSTNSHCLQQVYLEHSQEVYSVEWQKTWSSSTFLTASWDSTIKLWDASSTKSLRTFAGHTDQVFRATFSPFMSHIFASVGVDGTLKLWDTTVQDRPVSSIIAHGLGVEVLCCDWNKFDPNLIVTGASDGLIKGFDIRKLVKPVFELNGCELAVRQVKCSPMAQYKVGATSFDFNTLTWDVRSAAPVEIIKHHTEFAYGLDWSPFNANQLADCGWDSLVHIFETKSF